MPDTCSFKLGRLNSYLLCISSDSKRVGISSVTVSYSFTSSCVSSSNCLISLKDLSCPLKISVATTATLCARFLLCTASKISSTTFSFGSSSCLISSTILSKFIRAARVNAGLYFSVCKSISSSMVKSSS